MPITFKEAPPEMQLDRAPHVAFPISRPIPAHLSNDGDIGVGVYDRAVKQVQRYATILGPEVDLSVTKEFIEQNVKDRITKDIVDQFSTDNRNAWNLSLGQMTPTITTSSALRIQPFNHINLDSTVYFQTQQITHHDGATEIQFNYVSSPTAITTTASYTYQQMAGWPHMELRDVNGYYTYDGQTVVHSSPFFDKKKMLREFMKSRHQIRSGSKSISASISPQEQKARDCLRDMISESEWRRYVTNGFIMVKGTRGFYQIFQNTSERIRFYKDNKHIHNLCIHTDASCPPTDHVVNIKIMVECNEDALWTGEANVHSPSRHNGLFDLHTDNVSLLKFAKSLAA